MNKSELVSAMAAKAGISKTDSKKALDALMEITKETLAKNDKITLVGFGTFMVNEKPARIGRNPSTGAAIEIPAKKVAKFKVGATLADAVK